MEHYFSKPIFRADALQKVRMTNTPDGCKGVLVIRTPPRRAGYAAILVLTRFGEVCYIRCVV